MRILYVEPFEGGSHASFTRVLTSALAAQWTKLTLPGRHWKWRMRGSAVWAALEHSDALGAGHDVLLASSFVPLAELVGLQPTLASIPRVLYFHENQLAYPVRGEPMQRDHHFGFTQLTSALAATRCVFNSAYNRDSFLEAGADILRRMPDAVPRGWIERIRERSEVLPVPVELGVVPTRADPTPSDRELGPVILWNHRWEHDKNPKVFFAALRSVAAAGVRFRLVVCGEAYSRRPEVFDHARKEFSDAILHFGFLPDRDAYLGWLSRCDIAVSTAGHEFFGVAMIEAAHHGARPLVPDRLAYPEVFDASCRYRDDAELVDRLKQLCRSYAGGRPVRWPGEASMAERFSVEAVVPRYRELLASVVGFVGPAA